MNPTETSTLERREEAEPLTFEDDVTRFLFGLRTALKEACAALDGPLRRAADLQRRLGIPSTLAWQLHGVINLPDPLAAASQVPGPRAAKSVLAATRKKGVPDAAIQRLEMAFDDFEKCVERHAGGRPAFASMVSSLSGPGETALDLEARRDMFHATSHIYGVQISVAAACLIFHPGAAGRLDLVGVTGVVGLRVMRPFDELFIGRHGYSSERSEAHPPPVRPVDDPGGELAGVPLLKDFCSQPLPRITVEKDGSTHCRLYMHGQPVGRTGEVTYYLGAHWPNAGPLDTEKPEPTASMHIVHPSAVQIHDVLMAPGIVKRVKEPLTEVYGGADHEERAKRRSTPLRVPAQSVYAGTGVESLATPEVPRYVEMLRHVCGRMGWDPEEFDAYRCRLEFPVLQSMLAVSFSNPESIRKT